MNKRLFKQGDIVVCIDPPHYAMYSGYIDQLEYCKVYIFTRYKNEKDVNIHNPLLYLKKCNGFSGNEHQNNGNCGFLQSRFILRSSITDAELIFMKVKYKLGIKYEP